MLHQPTIRRDFAITSSRVVPPSQRPRAARRRQHIKAESIDNASNEQQLQRQSSQQLIVARSQLLRQGMAGAQYLRDASRAHVHQRPLLETELMQPQPSSCYCPPCRLPGIGSGTVHRRHEVLLQQSSGAGLGRSCAGSWPESGTPLTAAYIWSGMHLRQHNPPLWH